MSAAHVMEVLYNKCFGGFSYSDQALEEYCKETGKGFEDEWQISRSDSVMIEIVKRLGVQASGTCADIKIANIPKKYANHYYIGEYDGFESVQIDYKGYKLDMIRAALDMADPKEKIEAILAETDEE